MKHVKKLAVAALALLTAAASVIGACAETIYETDGYSYSIINNWTTTLRGWDHRTSELTVPDDFFGRYVVSVMHDSFQNDTELTALDFSQTTRLTTIETYAFQGCSGIANELVLPDTVTTVGIAAFENCSSIPGVVVGSGLSVIPAQCFSGCTSLSMVTLPDTVETIEAYAFSDCPSLTYMAIPQGVTDINRYAFDKNNITLGVYADSYAHTYAKTYKISYVFLDEYLPRDVNRDGFVDIRDVTKLQRYLAEMETFNELEQLIADIDGDGEIRVADVTKLQRIIAEFED